MEIFKCCHGMNPMYLNDLFCKQETKYDLRDKTLLEQPKFSTKTYGYRSFRYYGAKLWNALPFEIKNTDDYDDFKSKLTAWCHSSNLDKLEIFWFFPFFIFIVFVCICISNLYKSLLIILRYIGLFGSECTFTEFITFYNNVMFYVWILDIHNEWFYSAFLKIFSS